MFKIIIDHDNAAFDQDTIYPEIARILSDVAYAINQGNLDIHNYPTMRLRDINGNLVGQALFDED